MCIEATVNLSRRMSMRKTLQLRKAADVNVRKFRTKEKDPEESLNFAKLLLTSPRGTVFRCAVVLDSGEYSIMSITRASAYGDDGKCIESKDLRPSSAKVRACANHKNVNACVQSENVTTACAVVVFPATSFCNNKTLISFYSSQSPFFALMRVMSPQQSFIQRVAQQLTTNFPRSGVLPTTISIRPPFTSFQPR